MTDDAPGENRKRLIAYPEDRALEDAAYVRGVVPTRIFAILLPVWRVAIRATVTEGQPYELIDRYLEGGIATADLGTPAELADFFGLDVLVVDRALRFLDAIGHLASRDGRLALTELGDRSVRDKVRYVVTRQDRRTLYFDAFGSRPLTAPYYDTRTVTLLSAAEAEDVAAAGEWPRFRMLCSMRGFRAEALTELARDPRRALFNLPDGIDEPEILGPAECVFLPMYVVRAVQQGNRLRLLAYTQAGDEADLDVTELCERTPEITEVIEAEERICALTFGEKAVRWLQERNLTTHGLEQLDDGTWRVTLAASSFGDSGGLSISKAGSFVVLGSDILHVWCEDAGVRSRALVARIDAYLSVRARPDRDSVEELLSLIAGQLRLGAIDLPTLRHIARTAGMDSLAAQLDSLI